MALPPRYEPAWSQVEAAVRAAAAAGVRSSAAMVEFLMSSEGERKGGVEGELLRQMSLPLAPSGDPLLTLAVVNGSYTLVPQLRDDTLVNSVAQSIGAETATVVELGCGWGRNLFRLAARIGSKYKPTFLGGEITEAGVRTARMIAALDQDVPFSFHPFDYTRPDFSFVERRRQGVIFSAHSIEQIETLSEDLILQAASRFERCVGIHYEPVGWQREPNALISAEQALAAGEAIEITNEKLLVNAARHAVECGYNRNLLDVLMRLDRAGAVKVETIIWDVFGSNPFNPSTLIRWRAPA